MQRWRRKTKEEGHQQLMVVGGRSMTPILSSCSPKVSSASACLRLLRQTLLLRRSHLSYNIHLRRPRLSHAKVIEKTHLSWSHPPESPSWALPPPKPPPKLPLQRHAVLIPLAHPLHQNQHGPPRLLQTSGLMRPHQGVHQRLNLLKAMQYVQQHQRLSRKTAQEEAQVPHRPPLEIRSTTYQKIGQAQPCIQKQVLARRGTKVIDCAFLSLTPWKDKSANI